jgi:hypothetical protein
MEDGELKVQLKDENFKVSQPKLTGGVLGGGEIAFEEKTAVPNNTAVILVVKNIGSHMEDLTLVLRESFESKTKQITRKLKRNLSFLRIYFLKKLLLIKLLDDVLKNSMIFQGA